MEIDGGTVQTVSDFIFLGSKITADGNCSHEIKRLLLLGRKVMTNLDSIFKSRDITLLTNVHLVKSMVFPVVMYGCESWTLKKAEHWRIDAFELWWWRRLLGVPWTARRSNQSILKEISLGISMEGLMLKLKLQHFGHLMQRVDSLEDSDAGRDWGQEEKGTTEDQMAGWHHQLYEREFEWTPGVDDGQGGLAIHGVANSWTWLSDWTERNWTEPNLLFIHPAACQFSKIMLSFCLSILVIAKTKKCVCVCMNVFGILNTFCNEYKVGAFLEHIWVEKKSEGVSKTQPLSTSA